MVHANPSDAASKERITGEPPEKSQLPAIIFSALLLILWAGIVGGAEHLVGPIVGLFEWFELWLGLDILPGNVA